METIQVFRFRLQHSPLIQDFRVNIPEGKSAPRGCQSEKCQTQLSTTLWSPVIPSQYSTSQLTKLINMQNLVAYPKPQYGPRTSVKPILQGRKWRFREVQYLDQDHTARKRQSWGLNPECLLFPWCLEPKPCCPTPLRSQRRCLGGWWEPPVTPTFACSSNSSGDTGKCPVHLLQPPTRDWGIPGAGPQRECLGSGGGGGPLPLGQGVSEDPTSPTPPPKVPPPPHPLPPGLLLNAWEATFEQDLFPLG